MKPLRSVSFFALVGLILASLIGCDERSAPASAIEPPASAQLSPKEESLRVYKELVEQARQRAAAPDGIGSTLPPTTPASIGGDNYQVERWIYNLGYQQNLASRIRQEINLFAMLVPELKYFTLAGRYDKEYLSKGLLNQPLVDTASKVLVSKADSAELSNSSRAVIKEPFRTFIVDFSSVYYETPMFVDYLSKPFEGSDWRVRAIFKLNELMSLDRTEMSIIKSLGPVLLSRFPSSGDSYRDRVVESAAANLAFYRTAWAVRNMDDATLYDLIVKASSPELVRVFAITADAIASAAQVLSTQMDSSLPPVLVSKAQSPLDALK
ncbi:hypothetical protein [Ottowia sp.]|uniref:hypothetical protein n=1 Tax=Ottowia sp. TaxID=1898956 RepID=UPI0025F2093C|nr:hypothetical protein [Ottowia sp.]MBK6616116.1 hypothetical protein [Ottowia sp.]